MVSKANSQSNAGRQVKSSQAGRHQVSQRHTDGQPGRSVRDTQTVNQAGQSETHRRSNRQVSQRHTDGQPGRSVRDTQTVNQAGSKSVTDTQSCRRQISQTHPDVR